MNNPSMVLFLILLSMILHCYAERLLKNDFIGIVNINFNVFEKTWHRNNFNHVQIAELCQSVRKLPIFKISTRVQNTDLNINSETTLYSTLELDYSLYLTEEEGLEMNKECHVDIHFRRHKNIPAIICSRGRSIIYVAESKFFKNGYVLFWRNEYIGLEFLGLTLKIHEMDILQENPVPLTNYSISWETFSHKVGSTFLHSLPYKYLTWELCASTYVKFLRVESEIMNLESSFQLKEWDIPPSNNLLSFFSSKSKDLVLLCKTEVHNIEFYLILNPQNTKQLYVGMYNQMPSYLVELPIEIDTSYSYSD